jgi:hypothetical protein
MVVRLTNQLCIGAEGNNKQQYYMYAAVRAGARCYDHAQVTNGHCYK